MMQFLLRQIYQNIYNQMLNGNILVISLNEILLGDIFKILKETPNDVIMTAKVRSLVRKYENNKNIIKNENNKK